MGKKLSLIMVMLLISFIIVLTNRIDKNNLENIEADNKQKIVDIIENQDIPDDLENLDKETIDEESNEDPLSNLVFENGIKVNDIMLINNQYIALGEKDNVPYMQTFAVENNSIKNYGTPYLFTRMSGSITDLTLNSYYLIAEIENDSSVYTQKFIESKTGFIPFYKEQIQYNYYKDSNIKPIYVVIHETANTAIGADAFAHYSYWNRDPKAYASTHFVVDNTQIYQMLKLSQAGWHVGDNDNGYSDITNFNSVGIEIAVNADGDYTVARQNAIDLTIKLMKELDLDISALKSHNDASGKNCPTIMLQTDGLWDDFVNQVKLGLR